MQRSMKNALKQLAESTEPYTLVKEATAEKLIAARYAKRVNVQSTRALDGVPLRITIDGQRAIKVGAPDEPEDEEPVDTPDDTE